MASEQELSNFLIQIEKRALKQILFSVQDESTALDIIQDAMIKLAEKYGNLPVNELPLLFQRILQNTLRDYFRRQKTRNRWISLFSSFRRHHEEQNEPIEAPETYVQTQDNGETQLTRLQTVQSINEAVQNLPARQREAFLMRYWEEMNIAETAAAMNCSQSSVKTHCTRALATLASQLKAKGIDYEDN